MPEMPEAPPPLDPTTSRTELLPPAATPRRRPALRIVQWAVGTLAVLALLLGVWIWRTWESVPRFEDLSAEWGDVVPARPSDDGTSSVGGLLPLRPGADGPRPAPVVGDDEPPEGAPIASETPTPSTAPLVLPDVAGREEVETFLVFSTGTTEISDEQALAIGVSDPELRGSDDLTDVLMVIMLGRETGEMAVLSIPRDSYLYQRQARINTVFRQFGPAALAADVADLTGLNIDHVIRVNMMGFVQLTDVVGGVDLAMARPIRDTWTGLELPAGPVHIDGQTALRFVRARHAEFLDGEQWVPDGSADFGRMQRQRDFLVALVNAAWGLDVVTQLPGILDTIQRNVVLDEDLGIGDLLDLAGHIRGGAGSLPGYQLPADVGWVGPASVVFVDRVGARELVGSVVATVIS